MSLKQLLEGRAFYNRQANDIQNQGGVASQFTTSTQLIYQMRCYLLLVKAEEPERLDLNEEKNSR